MRKNYKFIIIISVVIISFLLWLRSLPIIRVSPYPNGLNFAFTITDDPDEAQVEKLRPVYGLLEKLGFKTTMAIWAFRPKDVEGNPDPQEQMKSITLENNAYLVFIKEYKEKGFEIALHTVTAGNDLRQVTLNGYERYRELFKDYPKVNIMHSKNRENIYWGKNIFKNTILKYLIGIYDRTNFSGEDVKSPYFWGDICKDKTKYVRLWGTADINTLKFNPSMPYHDKAKPYVNYWFSFSDGYTAKYFNALLRTENIDRLIKERGVCIAYTHFASDFSRHSAVGGYFVNEETVKVLEYIASQKEGWFVPVSTILDRFLLIKNIEISRKGKEISIINLNSIVIPSLSLVTRPFLKFKDEKGDILTANEQGELFLGDMEPNQERKLYYNGILRIGIIPKEPGIFERINLMWQRAKILLFSHRG